MNKLIIIGAGGHGKVVADLALKNRYRDICFLDDSVKGEYIGFPVIGTVSDIMKYNDGKTDFLIGIGSNSVRKRIVEKYSVNWITLIHPSAQIGLNVTVGKGSVVMAGAVINACATVGEHCIINTAAVVEHDNIIGNFAHISPAAALGGTVRVGEETHIGIGAAVINNIDICDRAVVGGGAVVVKNIDCPGTYVGVPARKIK